MVRRAAFTLIELVFAIVVIAITVISLPMMNQAVSKGVDSNIVQEAIFAASTELNEVVTAHWDENSIEPANTNSLARVIQSSIQDCENDSSLPTFRQMQGHINQPMHRRCLDSNATAVSATNTSTVDALEDMAHSAQDIFIQDVKDATGYKDAYTSEVIVTYPANFNGSNSNMKAITINIKNSKSELVTSLKTYSANIGEVDFYKRRYQ